MPEDSGHSKRHFDGCQDTQGVTGQLTLSGVTREVKELMDLRPTCALPAHPPAGSCGGGHRRALQDGDRVLIILLRRREESKALWHTWASGFRICFYGRAPFFAEHLLALQVVTKRTLLSCKSQADLSDLTK